MAAVTVTVSRKDAAGDGAGFGVAAAWADAERTMAREVVSMIGFWEAELSCRLESQSSRATNLL